MSTQTFTCPGYRLLRTSTGEHEVDTLIRFEATPGYPGSDVPYDRRAEAPYPAEVRVLSVVVDGGPFDGVHLPPTADDTAAAWEWLLEVAP